jgi:hypothetical protein
VSGISPAGLDARELRNALKRAVLLSDGGGDLRPEDLRMLGARLSQEFRLPLGGIDVEQD